MNKFSSYFFIVIFWQHIYICDLANNEICDSGMKSICYVSSPKLQKIPEHLNPDVIDTKLCTHIIMRGFAEYVDNGENGEIRKCYSSFYSQAIERVKKNQLVQVSMSLELVDSLYGKLLLTKRENFAKVAAEFVKNEKLDGLDLALKYEKSAEKKLVFNELLDALLKEFKERKLSLSATVEIASPPKDSSFFDISHLSKHLHWVTVLLMDYTSNTKAKHAAPFDDVKTTIKYWLDKIDNKADHKKLVLGMPISGRLFTLKDAKKHDFGNDVKPDIGELVFYDICNKTKNEKWTVVSSNKIGSYAYNGNQWVSFDDIKNIRAKAQYICKKDLGGGAIWSMNADDSQDICECDTFPLHKTLNKVIRNIDDNTINCVRGK